MTGKEFLTHELAKAIIGNLAYLATTQKTTLVDAINQAYTKNPMPTVDKEVYGVKYYYNLASPILERWLDDTIADLHSILPVQSRMKRCVLKDNGEVNYYLLDTDSTKKLDGTAAKLDGTDGQVMVEIPEHYRRHRLVENTEDSSLSYYEISVSMNVFDDSFRVNKCYISAYEASLDRTNNKLSSVLNSTALYRGGNNNSSWDGTYRSLLGMPATVISLTNFRNYAHNRGTNWNCLEWDIYMAVYWLYVIEYANLNCQSAFTATKDSNGRRLGGLGSGVTSMSNWDTYNSYYPIVPCGVTNSLGNSSGVVTHNVLNSDGTTKYAAPVPSYRGIENPFGHIWKWTDGFLALGNGTALDYYLCHDRTAYSSTISSSYKKYGTSAGSSGWTKNIVKDSEGNLLCTTVGGGSDTYFCDYHYEAVNKGTVYGVPFGGNAGLGALAGLACAHSDYGPSLATASIGSRLCWSKNLSLIEKLED